VSEKQLQSAVVQWARLNGWLVFHPFDSRRSQAGFPDLTLVRGERLMFAELKATDGRVTGAQQEWLAALAAAGCEVHVWRPGDWGQIERTLARVRPAGASAKPSVRV
jgi:hypothetical protein